MKVTRIQVVAVGDAVSHDLWEDPKDCACGPALVNGIVVHESLRPEHEVAWAVVRPGEDVDLVWREQP